MTPSEAVRAARAHGVTITVHGQDLILRSARRPPAEIRQVLQQHKADILTLLTNTVQDWRGEDWRTQFEERAAIIQFDGGYPRDLAERCAFEECVLEWRVRNPPSPGPNNRCAECRQPIKPRGSNVFEMTPEGPIQGHRDCEPVWLEKRRLCAISALEAIGLPAARA